MQIVHGQTIGFYCFIVVTNEKIKWSSLIPIVNEFQITERKYIKGILPLRTEFTEVTISSGLDLNLWHFLLLQIVLSNCSLKYHEEPCKFQLRLSGYVDGEYKKICL